MSLRYQNLHNIREEVPSHSKSELESGKPPSIENQPPIAKTIAQQRFQNQGKNTVSSMVGSYKSAVTKHANRMNFEFGWQSRFHDHIIRNDAEYLRITNYIENNPLNWEDDKFFKK